jgi:CHAT domain-containing protein/Flp pilus assembly protein TadD
VIRCAVLLLALLVAPARVFSTEEECRQQARQLKADGITDPRPSAITDPHSWELDRLGNQLFRAERFAAAFSCFEAAVLAARRTNDRFALAVSLKDRGIAHRYLVRHEQALTDLSEAVELFRQLDPNGPYYLSTLENLGMSYAALGVHERALALYDEELAIARRRNDPALLYASLVRLGDAALGLDRPELALAQFDEALRYAFASLEPLPQRWPLYGSAAALVDLGRIPEAIERIDRTMMLAAAAGNDFYHFEDLSMKGALLTDSDPKRAVALLREAGRLRGSHESSGPWGFDHRLARALRHAGEFDQAIEHARRAIVLLESTDPAATPESFRATYYETHQSLYVTLALSLLDRAAPGTLGDTDRVAAWDAVELGRSLRQAKRQAVDARLTQSNLPALLDRLGTKRALVEYVTTREELIVFVVANGRLTAVRTRIPEQRIADRIGLLIDLWRADDEAAAEPIARRLGSEIVAPWIDAIPPGVQELVICPMGLLNHLPFEYLPSNANGERLLDRFAISYVPSAAMLLAGSVLEPSAPVSGLFIAGGEGGATARSETARASSRDRWLNELYLAEGLSDPAHALPPLPGARAEVDALARFKGRDGLVLRGDQATVDAVSRLALNRFGILHFATHGRVSERNPGWSALMLSPKADGGDVSDGWLRARDISNLTLDAQLVVLSACETARGRSLRGDGVQSLARAFLHAGAQSVVASLWLANDARTAELMPHFYGELARGTPIAEALRRTKLAAERDRTVPISGRAAFVLLGDGHHTVPLAPDSDIGLRLAAGLLVALGAMAFVLLRYRRRDAMAAAPLGSGLQREAPSHSDR